MLIAIQRAHDFANLLFYFPGIHFDPGVFISNKNFHKGIKQRSKISEYQDDSGIVRTIRD